MKTLTYIAHLARTALRAERDKTGGQSSEPQLASLLACREAKGCYVKKRTREFVVAASGFWRHLRRTTMSALGWDLPSGINGGSWSGRILSLDKEPPTSPNALTEHIRQCSKYRPALTDGIEQAERRAPFASGFPNLANSLL